MQKIGCKVELLWLLCVGVVVADTEAQARAAAKAVKVEYEELPALISIEDAMEASSFYEVLYRHLRIDTLHRDLDAPLAAFRRCGSCFDMGEKTVKHKALPQQQPCLASIF